MMKKRAQSDPLASRVVAAERVSLAYMARVTLSLREGRGRTRIAVSDTGSRKTPNGRNHVLTALYPTKGRGQGARRGLTFCKNVVESHHGKILAAFQPSRGSRFTIVLPRRPTHADLGRG